MRTNIDLDESLLAEAFRYSEARTKKELVHEALEEFILRHRQRDVRELPGTVGIHPDYDYKVLRREGVDPGAMAE